MSDALGDADTVRELELRWFRAMRDGDVETLDELLADELCYLHSNATSDTKSSLLAKIRNAELRCSEVRHDVDGQAVVHGDTAIATGRVTGTVYVRGNPVELCNRALAVWSRRQGHWRLLGYQSTPIPAAASGRKAS